MKVPVAWLRDFVDVAADPAEVARRLAACGFAVESLEGDVIDFEVTANRPDCLSIRGFAREAAVAFGTPLKPPAPARDTRARPGEPASPDRGAQPIKVSIGDPGCGRYALAVADVRVGPSPGWLAARLAAAGVRAINNIVDVTNYVMLETGHPLHAFDAATLAGHEIRVRRARPAERLTTLDGTDRPLDETMLVIADRDGPIAVAGVMGGAASEVSSGTTRIALESAWFWPASVRATSRKLGLKTEASIRFERGTDIEAPVEALQRALALLHEIGAATPMGGLTDLYPRVAAPRHVRLRRDRIARLLGDTVPDADVSRILGQLGFTLATTEDGWHVEVPTRRVDVTREADLIEEVGRHWGFDRIPATLPLVGRPAPPRAADASVETALAALARGAGLQEAVTFTFIERSAAEPFAGPDALVAIANPLSEKFAVLRPSLLPGLVDALVYNRRREAAAVRLFEIGSVFQAAGESTRLGWVLTGPRAEHWSAATDDLDFFDAKGIATLLVEGAGLLAADLTATAADDIPWFVRGQSARLVGADGATIGTFGRLRPDLVARRGLDSGAVVGGELDLAPLAAVAAVTHASLSVAPLPRFPSVVRDLSIVVAERLPAATVRGTIRSNAPATLQSIVEFDRYRGTGVPDGHVSLSLRLTFRDADRTLTDADVQQAVDRIVDALAEAHGARLRGGS